MAEISYLEILVGFVGGLGLFIYGMQIMADGLQKAAGNRMKKLLEVLTNSRFKGVLVGILVTGIIQSSSATTVMVVGFVNAGLMSVTQSLGVIMGANIGTTVTSWLVSSVEWAKFFKPDFLAPIILAIGVVIHMVSKRETMKHMAEVLIGFGLLFIGISTMSAGVEPLQHLPAVSNAFVSMGRNPFLGLLAGAVVTSIIQSSSASVGILQSLAAVGLVPWNAAVYIIMGQNIGTCVTTLLSSIGTSRNAKSTAYMHLIFNIMGSIIFSIIAIIYFYMINTTVGALLINRTQISLFHTFFNVASTILLFPFSNYIIALAKKLANTKRNMDDEAEEGSLVHLDDRVLETPSFAIQSTIQEVVRMGHVVHKSLKSTRSALITQDKEVIHKILKREKNIDTLNAGIMQYMVKVCNLSLNEQETATITSLFHVLNDIERVGDHIENLAEIATQMLDEQTTFSEQAQGELTEILNLVISCYENALNALETQDLSYAKTVFNQEDQVDVMEEEFRNAHIHRLTNQLCEPSSGIFFIDILTNLERISDHALNIAQTLVH